MSQLMQMICASGVITTIMTLIISRLVNRQFDQIKEWQHKKTENELLLMIKMDKLGDLTVLMAKRLHDVGIINGDLEELKKDYKAADEAYDKNIKQLAAEVLRK